MENGLVVVKLGGEGMFGIWVVVVRHSECGILSFWSDAEVLEDGLLYFEILLVFERESMVHSVVESQLSECFF